MRKCARTVVGGKQLSTNPTEWGLLVYRLKELAIGKLVWWHRMTSSESKHNKCNVFAQHATYSLACGPLQHKSRGVLPEWKVRMLWSNTIYWSCKLWSTRVPNNEAFCSWTTYPYLVCTARLHTNAPTSQKDTDKPIVASKPFRATYDRQCFQWQHGILRKESAFDKALVEWWDTSLI